MAAENAMANSRPAAANSGFNEAAAHGRGKHRDPGEAAGGRPPLQ